MIAHSLDTDLGILYVKPYGPLDAGDFTQLTAAVDPWIKDNGKLNALIIETPDFPGWSSLSAMIGHFKFAFNHEDHIRKIALVTDSEAGEIAEKFVSHFVSAEIKHFHAGQLENARHWAREGAV